MAAQASSDVVRDAHTTGSPKQRGSANTMREKSCVPDDQTRSKSNGHPPRGILACLPSWTTHVFARLPSRSYMASAKHSCRETCTLTRRKRYFTTAVVRMIQLEK